MRTPELEQLAERLGVLDGTRGGSIAKRAVRVADMTPIREFPPNPRSKHAAGDPPTKTEFDALVDDVHTIFRQLRAQAEALRDRGAP